ncbi:SMP-30/gluconolaconase/LRE domain-containing protein [Nostoc commune NIES-4072]|uniref:SMP-30/gluconolaconase/LRE domain-containing protein n=1 Tax=Nostoc commune NIES-4072 TaxID=2005467 RepID=A0A2R5G1G7_NOSCO|nr:SMP-30/gluconolactonase/LRE family protein [Nostoc commune]BBD66695.1 SMP-30/gluconolaconase/LRE domain-containing protein [Nostoc commune HK-02]GBG22323.1 SMP-30/gluconolaconase/LRE domain-containing protein [Nostoc commune NIES-4072]
MGQYPLHNVLEARARLGEGPIWDSTKNLLYWVDIYNHRVHQFNPATGENCFFDVGDVVGAIATAGADRLIMLLRHHLAFLNTQTGEVTPILEIEGDLPDNRFNDGKCDSQGRFWFGSMCSLEKPQASLYRYDNDGSLHVMETGLTISNGLGWSPDQKTFYLTDSPQQKIYAYDFNSITGNISNRRVFIDLTHESFHPDGLAIDSEGHIWSAMWDGWCVIRFNPKGEEILRIKLPVQVPTSCTFGGEDLQTLYITTASVGLSQAEIEKSFYSGDLFALQTDVAGLPNYSFSKL